MYIIVQITYITGNTQNNKTHAIIISKKNELSQAGIESMTFSVLMYMYHTNVQYMYIPSIHVHVYMYRANVLRYYLFLIFAGLEGYTADRWSSL